jgi:hypothetical protein
MKQYILTLNNKQLTLIDDKGIILTDIYASDFAFDEEKAKTFQACLINFLFSLYVIREDKS